MRNPSFPTVTWIAIPPLLTAALCGGGTSGIVRNRNLGPQSAGIKTVAGLVTRTAIGITIGNVTGPKRETSGMVQNPPGVRLYPPCLARPVSALHDARTMTVSAAVLTSANIRVDMRALLMTAKQSRGVVPVPVHRVATGGHTPLNADLCHLHPCHIPHL